MRLQKHNHDNSDATIQAASDIFSMTLEHQIDGIAAIALRADGSHYIVISGMAIDQNIRSAGAAYDLLQCLNKLSDNPDDIDAL
jgi:hypothetical protein